MTKCIVQCSIFIAEMLSCGTTYSSEVPLEQLLGESISLEGKPTNVVEVQPSNQSQMKHLASSDAAISEGKQESLDVKHQEGLKEEQVLEVGSTH
jgi:hypothetical protein